MKDRMKDPLRIVAVGRRTRGEDGGKAVVIRTASGRRFWATPAEIEGGKLQKLLGTVLDVSVHTEKLY